jgi:hypothetical protein
MATDELLFESLKIARETSTELVTLGSAILAGSTTFSRKLLGTHGNKTFLLASWVLLLLSILFGVVAMLNITGNSAIAAGGMAGQPDATRTFSPYESNIRLPFIFQVVCFFAALAAMVITGVKQLWRGDQQVPEDGESSS